MSQWRLVGFLGFVLAAALYVLHLKGEIRHAEKESTRFESLYHAKQSAHALTIAGYHKATAEAKAADTAHALQVERTQAKISQEVSNDYQTRLAALRARYDALRLRGKGGEATADTSGSGTAHLPEAGSSALGPDPAPGQEGLSLDDRFICSAQAEQLDSLITWVIAQQAVDSP